MKREEYLELNQARLRLALRDRGYDRDVADCLKRLTSEGWEYSLQRINGKYGMIFFGKNIRHYEVFDELEDAVFFAILSLEVKK